MDHAYPILLWASRTRVRCLDVIATDTVQLENAKQTFIAFQWGERAQGKAGGGYLQIKGKLALALHILQAKHDGRGSSAAHKFRRRHA